MIAAQRAISTSVSNSEDKGPLCDRGPNAATSSVTEAKQIRIAPAGIQRRRASSWRTERDFFMMLPLRETADLQEAARLSRNERYQPVTP